MKKWSISFYFTLLKRKSRTLKDGSLLTNIHVSNNYFSNRNIFQNGIDALSKLDDAFLQKAYFFFLFGFSDNVQISLACEINIY